MNEKKQKEFSELMIDISSCLLDADGEWIAEQTETVLSGEVCYKEDSLWEHKGKTLGFNDLMILVSCALTESSGEWVEDFYNSICSQQISFDGDDLWEVLENKDSSEYVHAF